MYSEGVCADYRWIYDCSGPRPAGLVAAALAPQEQQLEVRQVLVVGGSVLLVCIHILCNLDPAQQMMWLLQWPGYSSSWRSAEPGFACRGAAQCILVPLFTSHQLNSSCMRAHAASQLWVEALFTPPGAHILHTFAMLEYKLPTMFLRSVSPLPDHQDS